MRGRDRSLSAKRVTDDLLRLLNDGGEMLSAFQALGVEFVDALCARRTCGEASTTEVAGRRRGATISEGECPYLGSKAFQPEDAALFFGRAAKSRN